MKKSISLDGAWRLKYGPATQFDDYDLAKKLAARSNWPEIDAVVPGNVEIDLQRAGVIEDPAFGTRIHALRKFETHEWWYSRTFEAEAVGHRAELVFDGLDCVANIWLNGEFLETTTNALVAQRLDVTHALRAGENTLDVAIVSPLHRGRYDVLAPGDYAGAVNFEGLDVRKPPHCWGWDIMPRLVSAGIWRGVRIEFLQPTRWRAVYVATRKVDVEKRTARIVVDWDFTTERDVDDLRVRVRLSRSSHGSHSSLYHTLGTHGRAEIELTDVDFWWPLGSGEAALYEFTAELLEGETCLDVWRENVGIRTVELKRTALTTPDGDGEFVFIVNGERVFIKGTNWVPLDALHSRDAATLDTVFPMVVDLGCNMLRCWGGLVRPLGRDGVAGFCDGLRGVSANGWFLRRHQNQNVGKRSSTASRLQSLCCT